MLLNIPHHTLCRSPSIASFAVVCSLANLGGIASAQEARNILAPRPGFAPTVVLSSDRLYERAFRPCYRETDYDENDRPFSYTVCDSPEKRTYHAVSLKVIADITGIDLASVTEETSISMEFGGVSLSKTLGEASNFKVGRKSLFFPAYTYDIETTDGDFITKNSTSGFTVSWSSTRLTVTFSTNTNADLVPSVTAADFAGQTTDEGKAVAVRGSVPVSIAFAGLSGSRVCYVKGTSSVGFQGFGSGEEREVLDLNSVSISGGADFTPPSVKLTSPKSGSATQETVTLVGTVYDGHGLAQLEWLDASTTDGGTWQDLSFDISGEPSDTWGSVAAAWELPLTSRPVGLNEIRLRATDTSGNLSPILTVQLVRDLPDTTPGMWVGLIDAGEAAGGTAGAVQLTVSKKGAVTGRATIRGYGAPRQIPLKGAWVGSSFYALGKFGSNGLVEVRGVLTSEVSPGGSSDFFAGKVRLITSANLPTETLMDLGDVSGFRNIYSTRNKLPPELVRRFNAYAGPGDSPVGHCHFSLSPGISGRVSISGRTADGSVLTGSGMIGSGFNMPFFSPLYSGLGSLSGLFVFDPTTATVTGSQVRWIRPPQFKDGIFADGFAFDLTVARGTAYTSVSLPKEFKVEVQGEGITGVLQGDASVGTRDLVTVTPSSTAMALKVNRSTGVVSGSFPTPNSPNTKANISGRLIGNDFFGYYATPPGKKGAPRVFGSLLFQGVPQ
jgi:hypothetical protein